MVLAVAPAVVAWLIIAFGVNSPYWDQILIGDFLIRNHGRTFPDLGDLFAQHNESRKFFPRILFFYLARLSGWNVKWEMAASLLVGCGIVAITWLLLRRHLDTVTAVGATAAAALLILSPVQWWNWMFGIQLVAFIPPLMLGLALLCLRRGLVWAAALATAIATFSFANGMLLWVALVPSIVVSSLSRKRTAVIWAGSALASGVLYFWGYHKPPGHPPLVLPFEAPFAFTGYCLAFLGHPVAWSRDLTVSMVIGAALCVAFAVGAATAFRNRISAALPWIAFGLYAMLSAAAAAAGRLRLSLAQSLEPRYATFSIYFAVAVLLLLFVTASKRAASVAVVVLVTAHLLAVRSEWPHMKHFHRERLVARTAIDFALVAADHTALQSFVYDDVAVARRTIAGLAAIGYLRLAQSDLVNRIDGGGPPIFGDFVGLEPLQGGIRSNPSIMRGWGAFGWAWLPGPSPADAVLVTRVIREGEQLIGVAPEAALERRGIGEKEPALLYCGWQYPIPATIIPAGTVLKAWAYDTESRRALRLAGSVTVPGDGQTASRY